MSDQFLYSSVLAKGYQNVLTRLLVGVVVNALAEFAPDLKRSIHESVHDPVRQGDFQFPVSAFAGS